MNEREAFEKWYKENVKMLDHTSLIYSIAISALKEAQSQVSENKNDYVISKSMLKRHAVHKSKTESQVSELFDNIDADITWGKE
jgi:phage anti-repressor protein